MNWDRIKGSWKQMRGRVKTKWGKVTNSDSTIAAGQKDQLTGKFQEGFGAGKEKVEKAVDKITDSVQP